MTIMLSLFNRFKREIETDEQQTEETLKTHYYKAAFNQVFDSLEKMFKEDADCQITTVSKERGEIAVEISKPFDCFLIVTAVSVSSMETAVDFTISTEKISFLGTYSDLKNRLDSYYHRLNQLHTNIGTK
ncbi:MULTISPECIES: hypothetical protein [Bacillaceae]|uniref:hypothetical protein n=1 Tax=Bacillaceae TaxID=186817 RepID=UPI002FFFAC39